MFINVAPSLASLLKMRLLVGFFGRTSTVRMVANRLLRVRRGIYSSNRLFPKRYGSPNTMGLSRPHGESITST